MALNVHSVTSFFFSKMAKNGQKWQKMAKNGQKWPKMAKNGLHVAKLEI